LGDRLMVGTRTVHMNQNLIDDSAPSDTQGIPGEFSASAKFSRLPKYVYRQVVSGHLYYRFRRPGLRSTRLPGIPGTPQFERAYQKLLTQPSDLTRSSSSALRYLLEQSLPKAKARSRTNNLPFDLTPEYLSSLMSQQGFKCALSGLTFNLSKSGERQTTKRMPFRPSIDRIDCALGYTQGNVRITCLAVNIGISDWGDDVFREICRAVANQK